MLLDVRDLETEITTPGGVAKVVAGVSLHVSAGETLGIVGESGCGKTMTAMSIAGLLPPGGRVASGTITLDGRSVASMQPDAARRYLAGHIGVIFQNPLTALNPRMTIGAQMREAMPAGMTAQAAAIRSTELLDMVGVPRAADRLLDYPHELSGGLAQRMIIAMSLARNPKLLIADEPTTALDVSIQAQILDLVDTLKTEMNLAVLLVTHDIGIVAERAQRVAVMYGGKIVEEGPALPLIAAPRHHYTRGLLDSVPRNIRSDQPLSPIEGTPPSLIAPPPGCRFAPRCPAATARCIEEPSLDHQSENRAFRCWYPIDAEKSADVVRIASAEPAKITAAERPDARAIIEIAGVSRNYTLERHIISRRPKRQRSALSNVSLSVAQGESLGIVGESGCGKSTLARLVAGLDRQDEGAILYRGSDISGLGKERPQWRRDVQMIFQDPFSSLDPRMTIGEIIEEPLVNYGVRRDERKTRIDRLLREVGLPAEMRDKRPAQLSGGQRQRIGIARALALDPKVIIADECVSALDVSVQATILNLFKSLQKTRHLTYLFISHDLNVVRYMCDRVAVMYLGKVVEVGETEEIFARPTHPYTRALLNSIPGADDDSQRLRGELPSAEDPPPGCRFATRCPRVQAPCNTHEPVLTAQSSGPAAACHFPLAAGETAKIIDTQIPQIVT